MKIGSRINIPRRNCNPCNQWSLPSKKVVMKIINGKTLETTDNQIIHIEGINTPDPNSHGYLQSKKDLEAILHQNATIKVIPSRMDDNGAIFAKVMLKSKNIGKIMQQKGWSGATTTFNARKMRKKNKWHEKYIHAKR